MACDGLPRPPVVMEVYPAEGVSGARRRQSVAQLERLHGLLALERAAFEAGRGTPTRITNPPRPDPDSAFDSAGARFEPSLRAAVGELSGELRALRRELSELRRAGFGPAAGIGLSQGLRAGQAPALPPLLLSLPADVLAQASAAQVGLQRMAAVRGLRGY